MTFQTSSNQSKVSYKENVNHGGLLQNTCVLLFLQTNIVHCFYSRNTNTYHSLSFTHTALPKDIQDLVDTNVASPTRAEKPSNISQFFLVDHIPLAHSVDDGKM